jgi:hypothetical protein
VAFFATLPALQLGVVAFAFAFAFGLAFAFVEGRQFSFERIGLGPGIVVIPCIFDFGRNFGLNDSYVHLLLLADVDILEDFGLVLPMR